MASPGVDGGATFVGFHYPCPDGVFAAYACSLGLQEEPTWLPLTVFASTASRLELCKRFTKHDTLYLVDFSGGVEFIAAACKAAKRVVVIDHHKTAAEDLASEALAAAPNLETLFDMDKSGATLARDYFKLKLPEHVNTLFEYIEDHDLWRHELPESKLFAAGLKALELEFDPNKNPGVFGALAALNLADVIEGGRAVVEEQDRIINAEVDKSFAITIPSGTSPGVPMQAVVTAHGDLRSTMGHRLASKSAGLGTDAVGAVCYHEAALGDDKIKVSLRSIDVYDTTAISQCHGGGGHRNASSFVVEKALFDGWRRG